MTVVGLTLDAGALIAFDRADRSVVLRLKTARSGGMPIAIPAGVLAQAWRDGSRQARLATLLASTGVEIVALDTWTARAVGQLMGARKTTDVVDASVVVCAGRRGDIVLSSDPDDLLALEPKLRIVRV